MLQCFHIQQLHYFAYFKFKFVWSLLRIIFYKVKFIFSYTSVCNSYFHSLIIWVSIKKNSLSFNHLQKMNGYWLFYWIWRSKFFEQPIELYNTFFHCVGINESIGASVVTNNCFHLCHMLRAETIESVTNGIDTKINYGKEHMSLRMKKPLEYVSVSKIPKINKWITKSPWMSITYDCCWIIL